MWKETKICSNPCALACTGMAMHTVRGSPDCFAASEKAQNGLHDKIGPADKWPLCHTVTYHVCAAPERVLGQLRCSNVR